MHLVTYLQRINQVDHRYANTVVEMVYLAYNFSRHGHILLVASLRDNLPSKFIYIRLEEVRTPYLIENTPSSRFHEGVE